MNRRGTSTEVFGYAEKYITLYIIFMFHFLFPRDGAPLDTRMTGILTDIVFLQSNDEGANSAPTPAGPMTLKCDKCDTIVGMEDSPTNGWRLLKANVSLNTNTNSEDTDETPWESHPVEVIIAAQLLGLIEKESARRFVVHCGLKHGLLVHAPNGPQNTSANFLSSFGFSIRIYGIPTLALAIMFMPSRQ